MVCGTMIMNDTMKHISSLGLAAVMIIVLACIAYQYLVHRVDGKCQIEAILKPKFDFWCLFVCLAGVITSYFAFTQCFLHNEQGYMRALMSALVMLWLCVIGYIDAREKIIPNVMILVGLLGWGVFSLIEIFLGGTSPLKLLIHSALGGGICGGILFVIALIVKTALGMGDVKMFFVLGLLYGVADAYGILLFTVIAMAVVSFLLLITKKVTLKTAIPMAPFVSIGFFLSILAGI